MEMIIDCPVCNGIQCAKSISKTEKIPHFGEILETSIVCSLCGYKHSDVISLEQKDPIKYTIAIKKENLSSRIIKSQSATVSIPELGLKVEPGPKSEGYVSNIEGVINRFIYGVKQALTLFDNEESQKNGLAILKNLDKLLKGEIESNLIIEDPFGQSKIMNSSAIKETLSDEEIKHLKTGITIIESES